MPPATKISLLPQDTSPLLTDILPMVDLTNTITKKALLSDIANLFNTIFLPPGIMTEYGGITTPSGWLLCYGQAVSRTTFSKLFTAVVPNLGTVTVTLSSPGVFTLNNHGMQIGDAVYLTTTGALPTGFTANTIYYVIATGLTTNAFQLASSRGGSGINATGSQSGTHSLFRCPHGLGDGATTFNTPDMRGRSPSGMDAMGGTAASRVTTGGSGIYGDALGATGGEETHTLSVNELASHSHGSGGNGFLINGGASNLATISGGSSNAVAVNSATAGTSAAHNNMEPSVMLNYIIKT